LSIRCFVQITNTRQQRQGKAKLCFYLRRSETLRQTSWRNKKGENFSPFAVSVIPTKVGIHCTMTTAACGAVDSRLRGNDGFFAFAGRACHHIPTQAQLEPNRGYYFLIDLAYSFQSSNISYLK